MIVNIFQCLQLIIVFYKNIIVPSLRSPLEYLFSHINLDTIIDSYISLLYGSNLIYLSGKYTSLCYSLEGLMSLMYIYNI